MPSQHWRKIRGSRYVFHLIIGNSFGRRGPFANTDDPEKLSRCKRGVILTYSIITSHLGLFLILLLHSFVGAAIFQAIEGSTGRPSHKSRINKYQESLIEDIVDDLIDSGLFSTQNETHLQSMLDSHLDTYREWLEKKSMLVYLPSAHSLWDFWGSLYFCGTVYTTIGYGNMVPMTTLGRWVSLIYALLGIPIFLITTADLGLLLAKILRAVKRWASKNCCKSKSKNKSPLTSAKSNAKRNSVADIHTAIFGSGENNSSQGGVVAAPQKELTAAMHVKGFINRTATQANLDNLVLDPVDEDTFNDVVGQKLNETSEEHVPFYIPVLITLFYAFGFAGVLMIFESWTFTQAFYFVFISFSTIGFGDIVPHHRNYFLASSLLVLLGLVLVAMTINVMIRLTNETLGMAKDKVDAIAEKKFGVQISEKRNSCTNLQGTDRPNSPVPSEIKLPRSERRNSPVPFDTRLPRSERRNSPVPSDSRIPGSERRSSPVPTEIKLLRQWRKKSPVPTDIQMPRSNRHNSPVPIDMRMPRSDRQNSPVPTDVKIPISETRNFASTAK